MQNYLIVSFFICYLNGIVAIERSASASTQIGRSASASTQSVLQQMPMPPTSTPSPEPFRPKSRNLPQLFTNGIQKNRKSLAKRPKVTTKNGRTFGLQNKRLSPKMPTNRQMTTKAKSAIPNDKNKVFNVFEGIKINSLEQNYSLLDEKIDENFINQFDDYLINSANLAQQNNVPTIKNDLTENAKNSHFDGKEIAEENVTNSNDVKIITHTKHSELNKAVNPEANNSNFLIKAFRFLFGWKGRRAKNGVADEFMPPLESPTKKGLAILAGIEQNKHPKQIYARDLRTEHEKQKSEENDLKDDEKVLGQLSESKQKSLLNLVPQLSQLQFYKNKANHFSESKEITENAKPSAGELQNSYGILMRLFKIKFKRLVDKNDNFVEELLENDYVAELVEKYFMKSKNMANSAGTAPPTHYDKLN